MRLSGSDLRPFCAAILGMVPKVRVAQLARFRDGCGGAIDRGIALYYPSPHSYTGEDVLELQGHGGPVVMQMLLRRCLEVGARIARPGEFTERAYLNGKMDLAQAEGVADLIDASTRAAARSALRSVEGALSLEVRALADEMKAARMWVEAGLDFPEEDLGSAPEATLRESAARLQARLRSVLERARQGRVLREGLYVVLAGAPNVGKSSLLNALAGDEVAIVTEVAGTTRDALKERIEVEGVAIHVIDTAGLRETGDAVERVGIERTWREIARADAVVQMVDARSGVREEDLEIGARLPMDIARVVVHNKVDLAGGGARMEAGSGRTDIWLSARTGEGLELLQRELLRIAGWQGGGEDVFIARERHARALEEALGYVGSTLGLAGYPELFAEEMRLAHVALMQITGEITADDLLGEIFGRFCIGK